MREPRDDAAREECISGAIFNDCDEVSEAVGVRSVCTACAFVPVLFDRSNVTRQKTAARLEKRLNSAGTSGRDSIDETRDEDDNEDKNGAFDEKSAHIREE